MYTPTVKEFFFSGIGLFFLILTFAFIFVIGIERLYSSLKKQIKEKNQVHPETVNNNNIEMKNQEPDSEIDTRKEIEKINVNIYQIAETMKNIEEEIKVIKNKLN